MTLGAEKSKLGSSPGVVPHAADTLDTCPDLDRYEVLFNCITSPMKAPSERVIAARDHLRSTRASDGVLPHLFFGEHLCRLNERALIFAHSYMSDHTYVKPRVPLEILAAIPVGTVEPMEPDNWVARLQAPLE